MIGTRSRLRPAIRTGQGPLSGTRPWRRGRTAALLALVVVPTVLLGGCRGGASDAAPPSPGATTEAPASATTVPATSADAEPAEPADAPTPGGVTTGPDQAAVDAAAAVLDDVERILDSVDQDIAADDPEG